MTYIYTLMPTIKLQSLFISLPWPWFACHVFLMRTIHYSFGGWGNFHLSGGRLRSQEHANATVGSSTSTPEKRRKFVSGLCRTLQKLTLLSDFCLKVLLFQELPLPEMWAKGILRNNLSPNCLEDLIAHCGSQKLIMSYTVEEDPLPVQTSQDEVKSAVS